MIVVGTVTFCATDSGTITGVTTVAVTVARTVAMLRDINVRVRSCREATVWSETNVSTSVVVDVSARVAPSAAIVDSSVGVLVIVVDLFLSFFFISVDVVLSRAHGFDECLGARHV